MILPKFKNQSDDRIDHGENKNSFSGFIPPAIDVDDEKYSI